MTTVLLYNSTADVQDRLSALGVSLRIDDQPPTVLGNVRARAALKVNQYAQPRYDPLQLVQSNWVNQVATGISVFYLCGRRMNAIPQTAARDYDEAIEDLKEVRSGMPIPDAAMRRAAAPALVAQRVQLWPFPHVVTSRQNSTGKAEGYARRLDKLEYWDLSVF